MAFQHFPAELLCMISSALDTKDYLALALVCRNFAPVAAEVLYHTVKFEWSKGWDDEKGIFNDPSYPPVTLFARSLLENPTLAKYVKHLRILGERPESLKSHRTPSLHGLSPSLLHQATTLLGGQHHGSLCQGNVEAWIHAILCLCRELRVLELGHKFFHEDSSVSPGRWPPLLDLWDLSLPNLRKLEVVDLGCDNKGYPCRPRNNILIASILRLDTINTMRIKYCDSAPGLSMLFQRRVLPCLTSLCLSECQLQEATLGCILCALPSLVNLSVDLFYDLGAEDGRNPFVDCKSLRSALENARQVETLRLGIDFFYSTALDAAGGKYYAHGAGWGVKGALGDLKSFTRLRQLTIAPMILFGWQPSCAARISQVIPSSVTELILLGDLWAKYEYQWRPEAIAHLMKEDLEKLTMVPAVGRAEGSLNLRSVTIHVTVWPYPEEEEERMLELRTLGQDAGVSVDIVGMM